MFVPEGVEKQRQSHRTKGKWVKVYYYRKRNKTEAAEDGDFDYVATSTGHFNENTFYRLAQASKCDDVWDYYTRLKPGLAKEVARRNLRPNINRGRKQRRVESVVEYTYQKKEVKLSFD